MQGKGDGDLIDSYDIIVRLNKSYPVPIKRQVDIGKRTDILYNCLNTSPESGGRLDYGSIKKNIKFLSMPYPQIPPFDRDVVKFNDNNRKWDIPFHIIKQSLYDQVVDVMKTRPNTGVLSIIDILSYDIKELYVTGFSFFRGGYDMEYRNTIDGIEIKDQRQSEQLVIQRMNNAGNHKQEPQIEYIKNMFKLDNRFNGDGFFTNIMNEK